MWRTGPPNIFLIFVVFVFTAREGRPNESIVIPRLSSNVSYCGEGIVDVPGSIFLVDAMSPGVP